MNVQKSTHVRTLVDKQDVICYRGVDGLARAGCQIAIGKSQRMTVEAHIRNSAFKMCADLASRVGDRYSEDCEDRGMMDPETGEVPCRIEDRGGTCICAERIDVANAISTKIRALLTPAT